MRQCKKLFLVLETVLLLTVLSGCWNYEEIEKDTIVAGIAIDKGTGGYKYHLTYEVLSLLGGKDQSIKPVLFASDGNSISDAIRNAVTMSDKKLYFSDCKIIVVSKAIAEEGITPLLDFLLRDAEPRITLLLAVSDENTAADIFNIQLKTNEPVSYKITGLLQQSKDVLGHVQSVPLYQVYNILNSDSQALTLPNVRIVKVEGDTEPQSTTNLVFRGDKIAGPMPVEECLYYLILKNKVSSGIIMTGTVPGKKNIALEILNSRTELTPVVSGNHVTMKIQVKINADISEENDANKIYSVGNGEFRLIEAAASKTVTEGVQNVILDMQKNFGADVFGFGLKINQEKYDDWEKIAPDWSRIFPDMKCDISTDVKIINSATALPKDGG